MRNPVVELLRFVLSLVIVVFHCSFWVRAMPPKEWTPLFTQGGCAVEFFFVLSGFLMARSISKRRADDVSKLGSETLNFIWRKVCRIWPYMMISCFMILAVQLWLGKIGFIGALQKLWDSLPELLFLQMSGFSYGSINGHMWYISAMLLAMMVFYPLARRHPDLFNNLIAPCLALFMIGWLVQVVGGVGKPLARVGLVQNGLIRAAAEICTGCFCFSVSEKIRAAGFLLLGRWICRAMMLGCIAAAMIWLYSPFGGSVFHLMLLFCVVIVLAFADEGVDNGHESTFRRVCCYLGALSLPVYINQNWACWVAGSYRGETMNFNTYLCLTALTLVLTLAFSAITEFILRFCSEKTICKLGTK